jgi:TonB family protein
MTRSLAVAVGLALTGGSLAVGQQSASQRIDAAVAQLNAHHTDSAEVLLRPVVDSLVRATAHEQAAAWLLIGVIDFYRDRDSAAAGDFRASLARTLALRGDWLARMDSSLGLIWRRERARAICDSVARAAGAGPVAVERVRGDTTVPSGGALGVDHSPDILKGPVPHYPEHLRRAFASGRVLLAGVLDTSGHIEPTSILVIENPHDDFAREARHYFERATFRPAVIGGKPVSACVTLPVEFRAR